jgi:hypothetical protein
MEKKQRSKWMIWTGLIIGLVAIFIGAISYHQTGKIDYVQITGLFIAAVTLFAIFIGAVFSSNSSSQVTEIKKDVNDLKDRVSDIEITITKKDLEEAEKEKRDYFIFTQFQHILEIDELCIDIEAETNDYLEEQVDLNPYLRDYIIELNEGLSRIIKSQYERGFKKFKINYFKSKLINNLRSCSKTSVLDNKIKVEIQGDIKKNICKYIDDLKLVVSNHNNGERRKEFIKLTLRLAEKIFKRSVTLYEKQVA